MDVSRRAYVYARYSSDNQREESIDAQVRACRYFAQHEGIKIVRVYADKEKSGLSVKGREEYQRMMRDVALGEVGIVMVHYLSRFGRNALDMLQGKQSLESRGIQFISVRERLDSSAEGKLMLMILAGINEFYSANLAVEVRKGMNENALKCQTTGGKPALGFDIGSDKLLKVNEPEAETIRLIFDMYLHGHGYNTILAELNRRGLRTKRGQPFGRNSLYAILRNERYNGVYTYARIAPKSDAGTRNSHKYADNYIRIEDGCPRIVDREVFEGVQKIMDSNKSNKARNRAKETYLLSGKLYCGDCGGRMVGEARYAHGIKYRYYACNQRERQLVSCHKTNVRCNDIEELVLDGLNELVVSKDNIARLARQMCDSIQGDDKSSANYKSQLNELDRKISRLVDTLADPNIEDITPVKARLNDMQSQRKVLVSAHEASLESTSLAMSYDQIVAYLTSMYDIKKQSPEDQRKLISLCVDRIIVKDDPDSPGNINRQDVQIILNPNSLTLPTDSFVDIAGAGNRT